MGRPRKRAEGEHLKGFVTWVDPVADRPLYDFLRSYADRGQASALLRQLATSHMQQGEPIRPVVAPPMIRTEIHPEAVVSIPSEDSARAKARRSFFGG